jgi:hypothetical protein
MDIRKYSLVNRAIQFCNKLPMNVLVTFPSKLSTLGRELGKW